MVKHVCIYCSRIFFKKSQSNIHVKTCERKFNEVVIKYKNYKIENLMEEYINIINGIYQDNKYECDNCGTVYTTYNGLKQHLLKKDCKKVKEKICDRIKKNIIL